MKQDKLCLVFNIASRYREAIYRLIDQSYPCDWYFGINTTDIKEFDLSLLHSVRKVREWRVPHTPFCYQRGIPALLWRREYQTFFMLGDMYSLSSWVVLLSRKLFFPKKKIYFWTHGWYGKETAIRKFLKKIYFKAADGVFLYGNYAKRLMVKEGFDERKLFVIHNSLDYDKQLSLRKQLQPSSLYHDRFGNGHPNLVFIGRLTGVKRIDLLLRAMAHLNERGCWLNLTLVGDGTERESLTSLARNLGIESQVWFYGACYDERRNAELIYNADLCVSPGNVGLTAMHTMMFGCPVITHDNFPYQMPEFEAIRQGETGDFFHYGDIASLEDCIGQWLEKHRDDREEVRKACFHEIDTQWNPHFQMEVVRENLK